MIKCMKILLTRICNMVCAHDFMDAYSPYLPTLGISVPVFKNKLIDILRKCTFGQPIESGIK